MIGIADPIKFDVSFTDLGIHSNAMATKRKRFETFTAEEISTKRHNTIPSSTLKNNIKWDKVFKDYLREKNVQNIEYWYYPDEELDALLCNFWFEVRTQKPKLEGPELESACKNNEDLHQELYSIARLRNMRNALSRCLQEHGKK